MNYTPFLLRMGLNTPFLLNTPFGNSMTLAIAHAGDNGVVVQMPSINSIRFRISPIYYAINMRVGDRGYLRLSQVFLRRSPTAQ